MYDFTYNTFRRHYVNPYRSGVKIGNYNEDLFGKELVEKAKQIDYNRPNTAKNFISESMDQYRWPKQNENTMHNFGNDICKTNKSNFDLNIVFNKQNFDDYMKVYQRNEQNPFILEDKNQFAKDEYNVKQRRNLYNKSMQRRPQSASGIVRNNNYKKFYSDGPYQDANEEIIEETQKRLGRAHIQDNVGIFNIDEKGINNYLLMGHGCQKRFQKTEYASMYDLTMSRKEKTDKILDPHYRIVGDFKEYPKKDPDFIDWDYRKYKIIGESTNKFNKKTNVPFKKDY
jgi:hypothetical protein